METLVLGTRQAIDVLMRSGQSLGEAQLIIDILKTADAPSAATHDEVEAMKTAIRDLEAAVNDFEHAMQQTRRAYYISVIIQTIASVSAIAILLLAVLF